jgi:hypothetical protein
MDKGGSVKVVKILMGIPLSLFGKLGFSFVYG